MRPRLLHFAFGARAVDLRRRHDLGDADLGGLELEQQEQPFEDRHVEPVLAQIEPPGIALLAHHGAGAAIIQQRLVELAQVDLEIEPIGRLLDQQALHVVAGEPHEIRLRQHLLDAGDELGPRLVARADVELEQIGGVAVGAEREIVLDQVEQAPAMLLMPPGGEAIERATPSLPVAAALGEHGDELGSEPIAADRDEPLAGVRLGRRGLGRLACPGCGRGRRRGIEQLHGAKLRRARRSQANAVSSLRRAGSARSPTAPPACRSRCEARFPACRARRPACRKWPRVFLARRRTRRGRASRSRLCSRSPCSGRHRRRTPSDGAGNAKNPNEISMKAVAVRARMGTSLQNPDGNVHVLFSSGKMARADAHRPAHQFRQLTENFLKAAGSAGAAILAPGRVDGELAALAGDVERKALAGDARFVAIDLAVGLVRAFARRPRRAEV